MYFHCCPHQSVTCIIHLAKRDENNDSFVFRVKVVFTCPFPITNSIFEAVFFNMINRFIFIPLLAPRIFVKYNESSKLIRATVQATCVIYPIPQLHTIFQHYTLNTYRVIHRKLIYSPLAQIHFSLCKNM